MNSASINEDLRLQERSGRQRLTFSVLDVLEFLKFLTKQKEGEDRVVFEFPSILKQAGAFHLDWLQYKV